MPPRSGRTAAVAAATLILVELCETYGVTSHYLWGKFSEFMTCCQVKGNFTKLSSLYESLHIKYLSVLHVFKYKYSGSKEENKEQGGNSR